MGHSLFCLILMSKIPFYVEHESTKYIRHSIFCLILLSNIPFYVQDESTKYFGHSIFCRFLLMSSIPFYVEHENNCPLWFYVQHKSKLLNWNNWLKWGNLKNYRFLITHINYVRNSQTAVPLSSRPARELEFGTDTQ